MRLNHIDLPVTDVPAAADFFQRFFGFDVVATKGRDAMAILKGEEGFVLVLTRLREEAAAMPQTFHVGFLVSDEHRVHELHRRLSDAELPSLSPVTSLRGTTLFYCRAPGGVLVEVGHRPDA